MIKLFEYLRTCPLQKHFEKIAVNLAYYLAKCLEELRPEEAGAARVLRELVKGRRLG